MRRTRGEALRGWGRDGCEREKRRWTEYWQVLEPRLSLEQKEKILRTVVDLNQKVERGKLSEKAARLRSLD
ncbi:MAG: hypothetical protein ACUVRA_02510 [Candidatus Bathyarchaeaceae archaeon]